MRRPLTGFLAKSGFLADINHIIKLFDKVTKLVFRNPDDPYFIQFGGMRDNDVKLGIRGGKLRLSG
jgi:hypothetical protein